MARGPAYPYINLGEAIQFARQLYEFAKRSPANAVAVIKEKWGYSPTSSTPMKVVAALRYFGLVEMQVSGGTETLRLTDRGYRILVDTPESPERKKALQDAALAPKAYKLCWERWGTEMPASMRSSLIFDHSFVDNTVDAFLKNYRKSLEVAGLLDEDDEPEVQADASISEFSDETGEAVNSSAPRQPVKMAAVPTKGAGMRQEVFSLAEGDVTIQWPEVMSEESLEDFQDWLKILERKVRRSVSGQRAPAAPKPDQEDPDL